MTKRIINKDLLRLRVKELGLEKLAAKADCSASLIQKLISDSYDSIPTLRKVDAICAATGEKLDTLFPVFEDSEESA